MIKLLKSHQQQLAAVGNYAHKLTHNYKQQIKSYKQEVEDAIGKFENEWNDWDINTILNKNMDSSYQKQLILQ